MRSQVSYQAAQPPWATLASWVSSIIVLVFLCCYEHLKAHHRLHGVIWFPLLLVPDSKRGPYDCAQMYAPDPRARHVLKECMHGCDMQLYHTRDQSRLSSITLYAAEALHCKQCISLLLPCPLQACPSFK